MLLTDSRDVLFQDDPFKGFNGGLMVFEEDCKIKLANDKINSTWIKDLFGSYALSQLGSYPILCAGTIMADAKSMRHFLFEYEKLVCRIHKITNGGGPRNT